MKGEKLKGTLERNSLERIREEGNSTKQCKSFGAQITRTQIRAHVLERKSIEAQSTRVHTGAKKHWSAKALERKSTGAQMHWSANALERKNSILKEI